MTTHSRKYLEQAAEIALALDHEAMERMARVLAETRDRGGRLFLLGAGGSAANASHAVNDFRKLSGLEAYAPTDNVAELTARTNDEGWETVFSEWLKVSRVSEADVLFVLSVGGGDAERNVSVNLIRAVEEGRRRGMKILGIVGRAEGYVARFGDEAIVVPVTDASLLTPHAEAFQSVILHALISHPLLMARKNKWEGIEDASGGASA